MKFLVVALAIIGSSCAWGADRVGHFPGYDFLSDSSYVPGSVGVSPTITGKPSDSRPSSTNGENPLTLSPILVSRSSSATREPSLPLNPGQISPMNTCMMVMPSSDRLPESAFSAITYNLLVCGIIRIGGLEKRVRSNGASTPFLSYIQNISTAPIEELEKLYHALNLSMTDAINDFINDCSVVNPNLKLSEDQAAHILETLSLDLFFIIKNSSMFR